MKHLIMCETKEGFTEKIASFKREFERDVSLSALQEEFPDADFSKAIGD